VTPLIERQSMNKPINVLIVEDRATDAEMLVRELRRSGFEPQWKLVQTKDDYLAQLKNSPDVILSDYSMPHFNGLEAAKILRGSGLNIPFILISGTVGEEVAVEAMKHGATDYLLKDRIARLGSAVRRGLKEAAEHAERKKLEAQFIEAQKMEVIGHLAGGVAHDFNNILAVIMGYSELMQMEIKAADPMRGFVDEIRHAAERAKGLTHQLLVFSRRQTVELVVLDLNKVVAGMEKMLRRLVGETIELAVIPGRHVGRVKADAGYVGQVLMNLVVNARDAMPNGGKIIVGTDNVMLDEGDARVRAGATPGDYIKLTVSDTGNGMTDEVKAHLFEAFFTTKPKGKGTGLGLATCQTIVKQCGGHIEVTSQPEQGTSFSVYLPRVDQPLDAAKSGQAGPLPRGTETLLVVEDEPSLRHLATSVLQAQGYSVIRANSGQDGLRVVREHKGPPISLVVTDVIMPQMGGKVMAEWLKATYPDLKVLFTSGYTDTAIVEHGVLDPGVAFLPKPYTPAALATKVREMLDETTPAPEGKP